MRLREFRKLEFLDISDNKLERTKAVYEKFHEIFNRLPGE